MRDKLIRTLAWIIAGVIVLASIFNLVRGLVQGGTDVTGPSPELVIWSLVPIVFVLVGTLILSRQPGNVIGWLLMLPTVVVLLDYPIMRIITSYATAPEPPPLLLILAVLASGASWLLLIFPIFLILLLFPTGHPPTPRWRWVVGYVIALPFIFLSIIALAAEWNPAGDTYTVDWVLKNPIGFLTTEQIEVIFGLPWAIALGAATLLCVASLVVRYVRAGVVERQQLKWLLFAGGLFVVAYLPAGQDDGTYPDLVAAALNLLFLIAIVAFPIAIGIAILRYRLFDIDILIRRTVTYAIVTALLAVVFLGSVVLLQQVFANLTGFRGNEIITVISTLVIATLFVPVRNRVQNVIDKRFNRNKYNAQRVVEKYAESVRDETDIDTLTAELMNVVEGTMQPKSMTLLLKKESGK